MRAALALAIVGAFAGVASASPLVTPPAGWKGGANAELVQVTGSVPHFGGVHGIIEAEQYTPKPGIVLDVARITATTSVPSIAARAELDGLKHATAHVTERVDDATKQVDATVDASDNTGPGIHQRTRVVIVATKDKIVAVQGDCIAGAVMEQPLYDACIAALATLDPGVDAKDRIAFAPASSGNAITSGNGSGNGNGNANASYMSDGARTPLPPMVLHPEPPSPTTDKRPFFVGAGIVLLAAVFWWNRRRRERFQAEGTEEKHD